MRELLAITKLRVQHWGMLVLCTGRIPACYVLAILALAVFTPDAAFAYDGGKFEEVCDSILNALADGDLGSLLAALSGVAAIIASAMGGFKAAWGLLVVSVGSYILKAYIGIWFDECTDGGA